LIKWLKSIYRKEQFNPQVIGIFINPFYFCRKSLYKHINDLAEKLRGKLLDVGCGTKPYKDLFVNVNEYIGLEIEREGQKKNAELMYDGKTIPVEDNTFDSILSTQVFEHVFNPDDFIRELNRVTKNGGMLLLSCPFVWDEHEQPYDYARYSSFGIRHILEQNGFEILELRKSINDFSIFPQLVNAYIVKTLFTENHFINLLITFFIVSFLNISGIILSKFLPKNDDFYLDNIVLARKIKNV